MVENPNQLHAYFKQQQQLQPEQQPLEPQQQPQEPQEPQQKPQQQPEQQEPEQQQQQPPQLLQQQQIQNQPVRFEDADQPDQFEGLDLVEPQTEEEQQQEQLANGCFIQRCDQSITGRQLRYSR